MTNIQVESPKVTMNSENTQISLAQPSINIWKKLRGGFLLVLGYLLSPLCWWNDLLFNLPIAYFFGYLCSLLSPKLLFPCTILGYWLSNIIGILLMQYGSVDMFQQESKERNLKKELFNSLISSTAYTLVIVLLIQLKIIDTPILFTNG
jgi:Zn-dependent protease with chaperone function